LTSQFLCDRLGDKVAKRSGQVAPGITDDGVGGTAQDRCQHLAHAVFENSADLALQVAIVSPRAEAAALRRLVADTGVAISVTACDGLSAALAHLGDVPCDAIVLEVADAAGLDAIRPLHEHAPATALVVLATNDDAVLRKQALACGAQDCLAPSERRPELLAYALRHAVARARRERGAHEHAAELRLLFDFNPHPMWLFDARTLKFLAVNQVAISAYGFSEREFLSMSVADIRSGASGVRAT
jgi:DNA-binding NarL/FixJ family response regulator